MKQWALGSVYTAAWQRLPVVQQEALYRCLHELEAIEGIGRGNAKEILLTVALHLANRNRALELVLRYKVQPREGVDT